MYPCHVSPRDMRQHPIGTGPFRFVEYKPNQGIKVERNPDYWKPGRPYLDGVEYTIIPNRSTAMLAFVAIKMLASRWLEIPITLSLAIMGVILSVCAIISWLAGERTVDSEQWTVNGSDGEANRSPLPDLFEWPSAVRQLAELGKAGVRG